MFCSAAARPFFFNLIFRFAADQNQSRLTPHVNVHLFAPRHKTRHNKKAQIGRESRQSANSEITSGHKENKKEQTEITDIVNTNSAVKK